MLPLEFQAVVLAAGKGSRMSELTVGKPKCLLPVGARPLVWYPLHQLEQSGFDDVILVVQEEKQYEIETALSETGLKINIDYFPIPSSEDSSEDLGTKAHYNFFNCGTADSLRLLHDKLKSDVLVLSCDLITDVNLKGLLNKFRMHEASLAMLAFDNTPNKNGFSKTGSDDSLKKLPGFKSAKSAAKPEKDLIGLDGKTRRLLFLASASDFNEDVTKSEPLFEKHPYMRMHGNLLDAHVYVLKNWIVKYLKTREKMTSIKGELLPHIVRKQLSSAQLPTNGSGIENLANSENGNKNETPDIMDFAKEDDLVVSARKASSFNDHWTDRKPAYHGDCIRCYVHMAEPGTLGVRVNTLPAYWSINQKISEEWSTITKVPNLPMKHPTAQINSTQVDDRCIIGEEAKLAEKTSFKNANIGPHTEVSRFSRVFDSIVMDHVKIGEKVAIENCIICEGAVIETGCQLKNCIVESKHIVPEKSVHDCEVLTSSSRLLLGDGDDVDEEDDNNHC